MVGSVTMDQVADVPDALLAPVLLRHQGGRRTAVGSAFLWVCTLLEMLQLCLLLGSPFRVSWGQASQHWLLLRVVQVLSVVGASGTAPPPPSVLLAAVVAVATALAVLRLLLATKPSVPTTQRTHAQWLRATLLQWAVTWLRAIVLGPAVMVVLSVTTPALWASWLGSSVEASVGSLLASHVAVQGSVARWMCCGAGLAFLLHTVFLTLPIGVELDASTLVCVLSRMQFTSVCEVVAKVSLFAMAYFLPSSSYVPWLNVCMAAASACLSYQLVVYRAYPDRMWLRLRVCLWSSIVCMASLSSLEDLELLTLPSVCYPILMALVFVSVWLFGLRSSFHRSKPGMQPHEAEEVAAAVILAPSASRSSGSIPFGAPGVRLGSQAALSGAQAALSVLQGVQRTHPYDAGLHMAQLAYEAQCVPPTARRDVAREVRLAMAQCSALDAPLWAQVLLLATVPLCAGPSANASATEQGRLLSHGTEVHDMRTLLQRARQCGAEHRNVLLRCKRHAADPGAQHRLQGDLGMLRQARSAARAAFGALLRQYGEKEAAVKAYEKWVAGPCAETRKDLLPEYTRHVAKGGSSPSRAAMQSRLKWRTKMHRQFFASSFRTSIASYLVWIVPMLVALTLIPVSVSMVASEHRATMSLNAALTTCTSVQTTCSQVRLTLLELSRLDDRRGDLRNHGWRRQRWLSDLQALDDTLRTQAADLRHAKARVLSLLQHPSVVSVEPGSTSMVQRVVQQFVVAMRSKEGRVLNSTQVDDAFLREADLVLQRVHADEDIQEDDQDDQDEPSDSERMEVPDDVVAAFEVLRGRLGTVVGVSAPAEWKHWTLAELGAVSRATDHLIGLLDRIASLGKDAWEEGDIERTASTVQNVTTVYRDLSSSLRAWPSEQRFMHSLVCPAAALCAIVLVALAAASLRRTGARAARHRNAFMTAIASASLMKDTAAGKGPGMGEGAFGTSEEDDDGDDDDEGVVEPGNGMDVAQRALSRFVAYSLVCVFILVLVFTLHWWCLFRIGNPLAPASHALLPQSWGPDVTLPGPERLGAYGTVADTALRVAHEQDRAASCFGRLDQLHTRRPTLVISRERNCNERDHADFDAWERMLRDVRGVMHALSPFLLPAGAYRQAELLHVWEDTCPRVAASESAIRHCLLGRHAFDAPRHWLAVSGDDGDAEGEDEERVYVAIPLWMRDAEAHEEARTAALERAAAEAEQEGEGDHTDDVEVPIMPPDAAPLATMWRTFVEDAMLMLDAARRDAWKSVQWERVRDNAALQLRRAPMGSNKPAWTLMRSLEAAQVIVSAEVANAGTAWLRVATVMASLSIAGVLVCMGALSVSLVLMNMGLKWELEYLLCLMPEHGKLFAKVVDKFPK